MRRPWRRSPRRTRGGRRRRRREGAMNERLVRLVESLGRPRVVVLGDLILDRYVWGDAERISQEAPVILLRADRREERLGGARNGPTILPALGAQGLLARVVRKDHD